MLIGLLAVSLMAFLKPALAVQAKTPVSIELVLAVDVSLSVDDVEFDLQMTGIANAFRAPQIIALIAQHQGVAVTLLQWSTNVDERYMIPWHLLHDRASILSFADKVERLRRDPVREFTAIGKAIEFGMRLIGSNAFDGRQLKIDVSADGRNNTGSLPADFWKAAHAEGIVINGLPILINTYNLDTYFREKVIHGPGAFIEIATDYRDFARAFLRKLTREITPNISKRDPRPNGMTRRAHIEPLSPRRGEHRW